MTNKTEQLDIILLNTVIDILSVDGNVDNYYIMSKVYGHEGLTDTFASMINSNSGVSYTNYLESQFMLYKKMLAKHIKRNHSMVYYVLVDKGYLIKLD